MPYDRELQIKNPQPAETQSSETFTTNSSKQFSIAFEVQTALVLAASMSALATKPTADFSLLMRLTLSCAQRP